MQNRIMRNSEEQGWIYKVQWQTDASPFVLSYFSIMDKNLATERIPDILYS